MPKAIIFDWDNTLVDSWRVIHDALNATLGDFGQERWTLAQTRERVGVSLRDGFPLLFGDDWERARDVFYRHFEAIHLDRLVALPGADDLLRSLSQRGIYLAVVSNKTGYLLRREVGHLGWGSYFARLVGSQDAPRDKPALEPAALALLDSPEVPGPDVWYVGDAAIDVEFARNAGLQAVLVGSEAAAVAAAGGNGATRGIFLFDDLRALHNASQSM